MKFVEKVIKIIFNIILILAVLLFIVVAYNFFNINILIFSKKEGNKTASFFSHL